LYLGTSGGAIYRSGDGGDTWDACAPGGWPTVSVAQLVVADGDPDMIYAGVGDSVWVSHDGGAGWQPFAEPLAAPIQALADARIGPGGLLAVAGGQLYRGAAAVPWQPIGLPGPAAGALTSLAGQKPVWLLAAQGGGIDRSDDNGAVWTLAASGDAPIGVLVPVGYHVDQAFAGTATGQLLFSADRGRGWQAVKQDLPPIRSIGVARLV
jgi:photosystem II stability/assembly factor-like uncharacterized protein